MERPLPSNYKRINFDNQGKIIRGRLQLENENYDDLERIEMKKEIYARELQEQMKERELVKRKLVQQKQIEDKKFIELEEQERENQFLELRKKKEEKNQEKIIQAQQQQIQQNENRNQQKQFQQELKNQLQQQGNANQFLSLSANKNYQIASQQASLFNTQNKIKSELENLKYEAEQLKRERFNTERNLNSVQSILKQNESGNTNQNSFLLTMPIKGAISNYAINIVPSGLNDATEIKSQFKYYPDNPENFNEKYPRNLSFHSPPSPTFSTSLSTYPVVNHYISSGDPETDDMMESIKQIQNLIEIEGNLQGVEKLKEIVPSEKGRIEQAVEYVEEKLEEIRRG